MIHIRANDSEKNSRRHRRDDWPLSSVVGAIRDCSSATPEVETGVWLGQKASRNYFILIQKREGPVLGPSAFARRACVFDLEFDTSSRPGDDHSYPAEVPVVDRGMIDIVPNMKMAATNRLDRNLIGTPSPRQRMREVSSYKLNQVRLRTYPQHTLPLLPLLRSRPGGVHKASVVRSPKSDKPLLPNANADLLP